MIDLDLETKTIVAQITIVGCWISNNGEIHMSRKTGFETTDISRLVPSHAYGRIPEGASIHFCLGTLSSQIGEM
jgi:hypothetical protein